MKNKIQGLFAWLPQFEVYKIEEQPDPILVKIKNLRKEINKLKREVKKMKVKLDKGDPK